MAREFAKAFYNSKKWKRCRESYIAQRTMIDGGLCEECHKELGYILHHKITLTSDNISDPEIALNHNNLMYVCKDCHDEYEGHGVGHSKVKLLVKFDEYGQPVSIRDIDKNNNE